MLTGMIDLLNNSGAALLVQGRMLAAGERAEGFEDTSSVRRLARLNVITIVSTPEKTTPHNPPQEDQP